MELEKRNLGPSDIDSRAEDHRSYRNLVELATFAFAIVLLVAAAVIIVRRLEVAGAGSSTTRGASISSKYPGGTLAQSLPGNGASPAKENVVNPALDATMSGLKAQIENKGGFSYSRVEMITATVNGASSTRTNSGSASWGYKVNATQPCHLNWILTYSQQGNEAALTIPPSAAPDVDLSTLRRNSIRVVAFDWRKWTEAGISTDDYGDRGSVTNKKIVTPTSQSYWKVVVLPNWVDPTNFIFDDRTQAQAVAAGLNHAIEICGGI